MKLGILGFAHGHVGAYMNQWRDNPELDIDVICGWDHDAARLKEKAEQFGFDPVVDERALLARAGVDAVVIASETSMHADLVEAAAAAGKPIVLQKPMALTLSEADRMVAAVENAGVPFSMAWQCRTDAQNLKIKEMLDAGVLGKIAMVRRRHGLSAHMWGWIYDSWHVDPKYNRDMFADDAAHPIDFMNWLFGLPDTVTAEMGTMIDERMPNDNGIAIYRYKDGPIVEVTCSFTCLAAENTVEIFGENGVIIQNFGDAPSCSVPHEGRPGLKWMLNGDKDWTCSDIPTPAGHGERIAGLAGPLADFLHGKRPPIATAEEGRNSLRMVLACYIAGRDGRRVSLFDESISDL